MGEKETYNHARRLVLEYVDGKFLDDEAVNELVELMVKQTKWTLKRMRDIMPKL